MNINNDTTGLHIKNKGVTKTLIRDRNNKNKKNSSTIHWDIDYDGREGEGNVNLDITGNHGEERHMKYSFDNTDLAKLLNIPSVEKPIHRRLQDDFDLEDFLDNRSDVFDEILEKEDREDEYEDEGDEYEGDEYEDEYDRQGKPNNKILLKMDNLSDLFPSSSSSSSFSPSSFSPSMQTFYIPIHKKSSHRRRHIPKRKTRRYILLSRPKKVKTVRKNNKHRRKVKMPKTIRIHLKRGTTSKR